MQRTARHRTADEPRIHLLQGSSYDRKLAATYGLARCSMDLIVDDGGHNAAGNTEAMGNLWPLLRTGGLYVIEDVATGGDPRGKYTSAHGSDPPGFAALAHNATGIARDVYHANEVFFADTLVGTDFATDPYLVSQRRLGWMRNVVDHNGHLVVIRRTQPCSEGPAGGADAE